uniref:Uncharacterized protein n=1 Tax=Picea glauca TaxID=3330 RepID=A0A101LW87_PICGL|nr:hypothetical protein ABT39_MTgene1809 [Picea glauca]QHR91837.1 hypothetical protein Q903MT_gene5873 [Picea sitchensis]
MRRFRRFEFHPSRKQDSLGVHWGSKRLGHERFMGVGTDIPTASLPYRFSGRNNPNSSSFLVVCSSTPYGFDCRNPPIELFYPAF